MASWKKVVGVRKDPLGKLQIYKTSHSRREAQRRWREKNTVRHFPKYPTKINKTMRDRYWAERRLLSLIEQGIIIPEYQVSRDIIHKYK